MNFKCQEESMNMLADLAKHGKHSILIEGVMGSGKTYLAKQYAKMLGIIDFQAIDPTVQSIRDAVDAFYTIENKAVVCIENLDIGVAGASYSLLKFLEEPTSNAYIVVTCRNIKRIPDTIVSRSAVVTTSPPIESDLASYAMDKDMAQYSVKKLLPIWKCARSFSDVDKILNMNGDQLKYFMNLEDKIKFKDSISQMMWDFGHYPDNRDAPLELVLRYIMNLCNNQHITNSAIQCLNDLNLGRIASHAVLARFCFDAKYIE